MAKRTLSFTVDEDVAQRFDRHAQERCINKSQLVQKLIKEYLEQGS